MHAKKTIDPDSKIDAFDFSEDKYAEVLKEKLSEFGTDREESWMVECSFSSSKLENMKKNVEMFDDIDIRVSAALLVVHTPTMKINNSDILKPNKDSTAPLNSQYKFDENNEKVYSTSGRLELQLWRYFNSTPVIDVDDMGFLGCATTLGVLDVPDFECRKMAGDVNINETGKSIWEDFGHRLKVKIPSKIGNGYGNDAIRVDLDKENRKLSTISNKNENLSMTLKEHEQTGTGSSLFLEVYPYQALDLLSHSNQDANKINLEPTRLIILIDLCGMNLPYTDLKKSRVAEINPNQISSSFENKENNNESRKSVSISMMIKGAVQKAMKKLKTQLQSKTNFLQQQNISTKYHKYNSSYGLSSLFLSVKERELNLITAYFIPSVVLNIKRLANNFEVTENGKSDMKNHKEELQQAFSYHSSPQESLILESPTKMNINITKMLLLLLLEAFFSWMKTKNSCITDNVPADKCKEETTKTNVQKRARVYELGFA